MFKRYQEIETLFSKKDWYSVCEQFERNKKKVSKNARELCLVAASYANLEKFHEAEQTLTFAIIEHPDESIVYKNLAALYLIRSRDDDHFSILQTGVTRCSSDPHLLNEFINVCFTKEQFQTGLSAIEAYEKQNGLDHKLRYNKGLFYERLNAFDKAEKCYAQSIGVDQNYIPAILNLGLIKLQKNSLREAEILFKRILELNPNVSQAHYNIGLVYTKLGLHEDAFTSFEDASLLRPNNESIMLNKAVAKYNLGHLRDSKELLNDVLTSFPKCQTAIWNLHGLSQNEDEALYTLNKDTNYDQIPLKHLIARAILEKQLGDDSGWKLLETSEHTKHPLFRSFEWLYSLGNFKLYFNRWQFFDEMIKLCPKHELFFEFGVYRGLSLKYLKQSFIRGVGFDTFTGLPERWHREPQGSYSAENCIPEIEGVEFVVGKFEDTLSTYFHNNVDEVDLINFDADLYSSTICALDAVSASLKKDTILIFDEMIGNPNWEEDEARALLEFCEKNSRSFEVIAASYFSKQVAVRVF